MTDAPAPIQTRPTRTSWVLLGVSGVLFLLTLYWLAREKWPLGVAGEWTIAPNEGPWPWQAWGLPLAVLFIFGGLAAISAYDRFRRAKTTKEQRVSTVLCLVGLTIMTFTLPWSLLGPGGTQNLISSQWSDISNEYFGTAYQIDDAREFAREYSTRWQQPESPVQAHVATHPPGAVLFYYGARRVYEAAPPLQSLFSGLAVSLTRESVESLASQSNQIRSSARRSAGVQEPAPPLPMSAVGAAIWCAALITLLLASCVPAVYYIASLSSPEVSQDTSEARGMVAAALFALTPTLSLFAFTLDAVVACGAAWTMAFVALRLHGGGKWWLLLSGAAMAVTSFVSFGALAIGAIAVIVLVFAKRPAALADVPLFMGGFVAGWLLLVLLFPSNPLAIFLNAMDAHRFATVESRSRLGWLWMNVVSFAVFCGWPLIVAACVGAVSVVKNLVRSGREHLASGVSTPAIIGFAALATMLLLTFSGAARGEVERLWLFLTPALACLAADTIMRRPYLPIVGVLLALQAAQMLVMAGWLAPLVLPL